MYNERIVDETKKEAKLSMKELVTKTKETAPIGNRKKHYKDNIKYRKLYENSRGAAYQWYVGGSDYRLSHLLENGHVTRNGGRTRATHFIRNACEPIIKNFIKKIEEVIKNG